jgi:heat-inducible transcriptional repressor
VLARLSAQVGVTISPHLEASVLRRIDLMPVTESKMLMIMTVRSGLVKTVLLEVDSIVSSDELLETTSLLNEKLSGLTLGEIRATIRKRLHDTGRGNPQVLKVFVENQESVLDDSIEVDLHADGTTNIVLQQEFREPKKLHDFLSLLEERRSLIRLLHSGSSEEGIRVTIGTEASLNGLEGCATVTKTYSAGHARGTIGVIGPTRMEYAKLMSVVDYTARVLSEILSR